MARTLVALDIGAQLVRAAVVSQNGKDFTLERVDREPIAPEEGPRPAVDRLLQHLGVPAADTVVGTIPLQNVSLRNLVLPFADRKKLDQVLPFELENVFPFDIDDAVFNYSVLKKRDEGADVLVAATRKELVETRLETYRDGGHEPTHLMIDAFSLDEASRPGSEESLLELEDDDSNATVGYIHVGWEDASILLVRGDGYRFARAFRNGRRECLARAARASQGDASEMEAAFASGEGSEKLGAVFAPLVRDIEATLRSSEKSFGFRPRKVIVSGDATAWPGFVDAIGQAIRVPAEAMVWPEPYRGETDGFLGDYAPLVAAAMASQRKTGLNMRCGEYAYTRAIQLVKGKLIVSGAFAAVLFLLVVGNLLVQYISVTSENSQLSSEIQSIFQEALPNQPIVDPVVQMRNQLKSLQAQAAGGTGEGIVDMLKGMSESVKPGTEFKINEFHKDAGGIRIKAVTDSYEEIEQIKSSVAAVPGLENVKVSDSKTSSAGVVFELSVEGAGG